MASPIKASWQVWSVLCAAQLMLFILCYLALTDSLVATEEINLSKNGIRLYRDLPFTGTAVSHHENGTRRSEEQFKEGRRSGYLREWFDNGTLAYEAEFLAGERHGQIKSWWRNGNPRSSSFFQRNVIDGESLHWYRTGELFKRLYFNQGKPEGLQQGWRLNGKLFSNYEYRDGRVYGLNKANLCVELKNEEIAQFTQLN